MRSLITGVTGFVGSHLAEHLLEREAEVFGTARWRSDTSNIDHLVGRIELVECDIRDSASVKKVIFDVRPDEIYHLAAQSYVPTSWRAPSETLETNIIGQVHLLEAVRVLGTNPRIHVAGSSEEYGMVYPDELPIRETNPLRPLSPYAVSKVGQDMLAYQYFMTYKLHLVRTRAFNHTGPRRGSVFVTSNFAKQIADIEKGRQDPVIRVGNLDARRDFSDVRDIVLGYVLALRQGEPGEVYNLCSGQSRTIRQMLDLLLSFSAVKVRIEHDPARLRPSDVPVLQGDYSKLHARTGWQPRIPFERTAADLLAYWRQQP